jgi:hypothetical protein
MKFEKGYRWFVALAFVAGVICCLLPQRSVSTGGTNVPNGAETASPAYSYTPATESPNGSASDKAANLPESDSDNATLRNHKFDKYDCTLDCSGHKAGYEWAERKSISDAYDCDVAGNHYNSLSFAEGCRAYVDGETEPDDD